MSLVTEPTPTPTPTPPATPPPPAVPGEGGLWLFLLADMTVFAVFFVIVIVMRADDPAQFTASSARLNQTLGAVGTLLLVTSSLLVVLAVGAARRADSVRGRRLLAAALACGLAFVALKGVDWAAAIRHGDTVSSSDFFGVYFMLTGIHLLHVVVGVGVLLVLRRQLARPEGPDLRIVEGGASYWHMVDLLWLVLFPVLYLLG